MIAPANRQRRVKPRDCSKVANEMCYCGHLKTQHDGQLRAGACNVCVACVRFTWKYFVDAEGKQI